MFLSIFDIFKVGIGPSSSHTNGPMIAASMFLHSLKTASDLSPETRSFSRITCTLHGSLAFTGKGHNTDRAILFGMAGLTPENFGQDRIVKIKNELSQNGYISVNGFSSVRFCPDTDIIFDYGPALKQHANGMIFRVFDADGNLCESKTFFSIGGGFVKSELELGITKEALNSKEIPYPFSTAEEMIQLASANNISISKMKKENELVFVTQDELNTGITKIWANMNKSIQDGLHTDGILPGGLKLRRRAKALYKSLNSEKGLNSTAPHVVNDWIALYAMAVNEENAAGGKIVTAPTNGAAGVIPATLMYYLEHVPNSDPNKINDFLLTAAAIGGILKSNASISGAEVGCQGEVGSAAAMAAAGLCSILGGSAAQIENAAEIALEHHLGMTCDPIKGLVQAPCIERNGLGAIKAVSAASLALRGDGIHLVSLDACIKTMFETGKDMMVKYKETSQGGLAVNVIEC